MDEPKVYRAESLDVENFYSSAAEMIITAG